MIMGKRIVIFFFVLIVLITAFSLYSCSFDDSLYSPASSGFDGQTAAVTVRDIRAKGFTLDWTDIGENYEYAIAASHSGGIENYETALENGRIVLDFTASELLGGTYKVTKLIAGKDYAIKLFVRERNAKNAKITEYLKAKATLPYIDDAEIFDIWVNGNETVFDKTDDSFSYYYLYGSEETIGDYTFTYKLMRGCVLYINGEKIENKEVPFTPDKPVELTVVHEKTQAARDYVIYVDSRTSSIPTVVIDTKNGDRIRDKNNAVTAHMKIIDVGNNPKGTGLYDGEIEIRGRGNSSFGMPKRGYNFEIAEKTAIFGMAPSRDWMLIANFSDKSLMRNYTAYEFARDLGMDFAPRLKFVDLILNGEYLGTYCVGERIKVDTGRLDFPKVKADTTDEYELTGTYVLEVNSTDKWNPNEIYFETSKINVRRQHFLVIQQPGAANLSDAAYEYIANYVNEAEDALFGNNFKDPETGYRAYLDTASFIDWYLVNELYKNVDAGFHTSVFMYKPRGEKLHMGPVWDFDLGGGNADYSGCDDPEGWYVRYASWIERLFEDKAFAQEFKDRWNYIKNNGYFDVFFKRIDDTAARIGSSAELNFSKWPILGVYVWPNAGNVQSRTTYQSEIDYLKEWLTLRIEWMDREINKY